MNCCNNIRNEKAMIMKNIYELGFALVETMLILIPIRMMQLLLNIMQKLRINMYSL